MSKLAYLVGSSAFRKLRKIKNQFLNSIDPPILVLIYHRVASLENDSHLLSVTPENFQAQMKFLKDHYSIIRFDENWTNFSGRAVVITFDDGYADNFLNALPLLEELGVPATFFISTGNLRSGKEYWWDELEGILLADNDYPPQFCLQDPIYGGKWPTINPKQRKILHDELHKLFFRSIKAPQRENWLGQLRQWARRGETEEREINRPMNFEEVQGLAASSWATVGCHTVTHTPLNILSKKEQQEEILNSKKFLENLIGEKINVFSYPFGTKDHYNRITLDVCKNAGFLKVAANFPGQFHRWTDPYEIPRQLVRNWDIQTFSEKMESFWT